MIVLDTNVVSELMRGDDCNGRVSGWFAALRQQPVTSVITRAEILSGIEAMPPGRRRDRLRESATVALGRLGACIPFTSECADEYARLTARRRAAERPLIGFDGLIAAIAARAGGALATRDVRDFEGIGLHLVNPWE